MPKKEIPDGVVHRVPVDLRKALISAPKALRVWEDITPLARAMSGFAGLRPVKKWRQE